MTAAANTGVNMAGAAINTSPLMKIAMTSNR
jgi:hypothetical protein